MNAFKRAAAVGLVLSGLLLGLAPLAQASSLTSQQVSAIISLLQSFGADSGTIANVAATLGGSAPSSSCVTLSSNLTLGSTGSDVTSLQNYLIEGGYLPSGDNTGYYGYLTASAVGQLQVKLGIVSSQSDSAYGITGPQTRAAVGCNGSPNNPVQPTNPIQPSGTPNLSLTNISGLTVTLQYSNMPPAALEVFNYPVTSTNPIWKQELNSSGSSGTMSFTLPSGTPNGQYYLIATDANGNAIESKDASGNQYPLSIQFTVTNGN